MVGRMVCSSWLIYALIIQLVGLYTYLILVPRVTKVLKMDCTHQSQFDLGYQSNSPDGVQRKNRLVNRIITEYDEDINRRFQSLVKRKASPNDPKMLQLIREMMDPPSENIIKTAQYITETPQSREINSIFSKKEKGFFVECGALNGETTSNTIYMNHYQGWRGLLVEMDPFFYTALRSKNRKAWTLNACMSPYPYPIEMEYVESTRATGTLLEGDASQQNGVLRKTPCFPFESMLHAINVTKIDYFSLDVEGFEMQVLRTLNFEIFDISTLSVEYVHGKASKEEYRTYMESKGYLTYKDINVHDRHNSLFVDDYIFVKQSLASSLGLKEID